MLSIGLSLSSSANTFSDCHRVKLKGCSQLTVGRDNGSCARVAHEDWLVDRSSPIFLFYRTDCSPSGRDENEGDGLCDEQRCPRDTDLSIDTWPFAPIDGLHCERDQELIGGEWVPSAARSIRSHCSGARGCPFLRAAIWNQRCL